MANMEMKYSTKKIKKKIIHKIAKTPTFRNNATARNCLRFIKKFPQKENYVELLS